MKRFLFLFMVLGPITGSIATADAARSTTVTGLTKLTASDGIASDRFGISVAVSGDTAVVGAPWEGAQRGAAYVYSRVGGSWVEQAKLTASDALATLKFGFSVAISDDTIVVGTSPYHWPLTQGSAYVFQRIGDIWTEQAKLTASDGGGGDNFGASVAVSGGTALVGASGISDGRGAAYLFTRTTGVWTQKDKLTASDGAQRDTFGQFVALSGDTALIGAIRGDGATPDQGSAYVFTQAEGKWNQQDELTASGGAAGDAFGFWVSVSGDTAVVGAPGDDNERGSAYVFTRTGADWPQQDHLTASDGAVGDQFGRSVAVSGETVVVGAQKDDIGTNLDQGSAYVFTRTGSTWPEQAKLVSSDGGVSDLFGVSVATSGGTAVIGAGFHNLHQGAAYMWEAAPSEPETLGVMIDVKPGDDTNRVRPSSPQPIAVAVLTTPTFDAATVDPSTVCFGDDPPAGGTTSYTQPPGVDADCNEAHRIGHVEDVDGDGDLDMVLHFEAAQTGIDAGDTQAGLTGSTKGGTSVHGSDSINVVP